MVLKEGEMKKYAAFAFFFLVLAFSVSAGGQKDKGSSGTAPAPGGETVTEESSGDDPYSYDDSYYDDGSYSYDDSYYDDGSSSYDNSYYDDGSYSYDDSYYNDGSYSYDDSYYDDSYPYDDPYSYDESLPSTAPAASAAPTTPPAAGPATDLTVTPPSQTPSPGQAPPAPRPLSSLEVERLAEAGWVRTAHYEVFCDSGEADGAILAREMESRFEEYNRLFRFDTGGLPALLRVKSFGSKETYDAYLGGILGSPKPGAVYLHYQDPAKRELILHRGGAETAQIFPHQAFIQFFRAFITNPPAWMREGFALYFHAMRFAGTAGETRPSGDTGTANKTSAYAENIAWRERVKKMGNGIPPVRTILRIDLDGPQAQTELVSWALVSFLMNSGDEGYFRTLVECFMVLSAPATAAENAEAVIRRISRWTSMDTLEADFRTYIASRWTFADLVDEGRQAYDAKNFDKARQSFLTALDYNPAHYVPYYYLGLLAYESKDYAKAEEYYRSALRFGADPAQTAYAWGVSEISAGHNEKALGFLEVAATVSPERYGERVDQLRARLKK
jgi:tetratricopeptide (TPR) repeat protein